MVLGRGAWFRGTAMLCASAHYVFFSARKCFCCTSAAVSSRYPRFPWGGSELARCRYSARESHRCSFRSVCFRFRLVTATEWGSSNSKRTNRAFCVGVCSWILFFRLWGSSQSLWSPQWSSPAQARPLLAANTAAPHKMAAGCAWCRWHLRLQLIMLLQLAHWGTLAASLVSPVSHSAPCLQIGRSCATAEG